MENKKELSTKKNERWESMLRGSLLTSIMQKNIQYIARADARAQIMIAISSFVIPVALTGLENDTFALSALLAVATAVGTIVTAVWVLFPKKYQHKKHGYHNMLHFSQVAKMPEDEYLQKMQDATTNTGKLTKMFVEDLYHLSSRILAPKFMWLRISYSIFLIGNIITICTTLISIGMM